MVLTQKKCTWSHNLTPSNYFKYVENILNIPWCPKTNIYQVQHWYMDNEIYVIFLCQCASSFVCLFVCLTHFVWPTLWGVTKEKPWDKKSSESRLKPPTAECTLEGESKETESKTKFHILCVFECAVDFSEMVHNPFLGDMVYDEAILSSFQIRSIISVMYATLSKLSTDWPADIASMNIE